MAVIYRSLHMSSSSVCWRICFRDYYLRVLVVHRFIHVEVIHLQVAFPMSLVQTAHRLSVCLLLTRDFFSGCLALLDEFVVADSRFVSRSPATHMLLSRCAREIRGKMDPSSKAAMPVDSRSRTVQPRAPERVN